MERTYAQKTGSTLFGVIGGVFGVSSGAEEGRAGVNGA